MVINTALSRMAYDYPPEKLNIYISDDSGSELMFYALLQASHFCPHLRLPTRKTPNFYERSRWKMHNIFILWWLIWLSGCLIKKVGWGLLLFFKVLGVFVFFIWRLLFFKNIEVSVSFKKRVYLDWNYVITSSFKLGLLVSKRHLTCHNFLL